MTRIDAAEIFTDEADHEKFIYTQPDEALRGFKSKYIELGSTNDGKNNLGIFSFPDLDGNSVFIPRILQDGVDYIIEPMKKAGAEVSQGKLKTDEKSRLVYCLEELKWPILLAAQSLDPDFDISKFAPTKSKPEPTIFLTIQGNAGVGKSTLIATLALKYGTPFASLDVFSGKDPQSYLDFFKRNGLNSHSEDGEILATVAKFRREYIGNDKKPIKPTLLRDLLVELAQSSLNENWKGAVLLEGVGSRGRGLMSVNSYHLASVAGEYLFTLDRRGQLGEDASYFQKNILDRAEKEGVHIQKEFLRLIKE